jgi:hypothetical protein
MSLPRDCLIDFDVEVIDREGVRDMPHISATGQVHAQSTTYACVGGRPGVAAGRSNRGLPTFRRPGPGQALSYRCGVVQRRAHSHIQNREYQSRFRHFARSGGLDRSATGQSGLKGTECLNASNISKAGKDFPKTQLSCVGKSDKLPVTSAITSIERDRVLLYGSET